VNLYRRWGLPLTQGQAVCYVITMSRLSRFFVKVDLPVESILSHMRFEIEEALHEWI